MSNEPERSKEEVFSKLHKAYLRGVGWAGRNPDANEAEQYKAAYDYADAETSALEPSPIHKGEAIDGNDWSFQQRVGGWMAQCFTPEIIADKLERNDRFIEEALELVQSLGYSADRAHALVEYVFNRPAGEPTQEVGGVMVTLAALCNPNGLNMEMDGEVELARILDPAIVLKIRAKQAAKPTGSALPVPSPHPTIPPEEATPLTLDEEELDTILAVGRNKQSGRITNYELKELVRVYRATLNTTKEN